MHQEALIIMELQEMEMSSHRNAKNLLQFLWAKQEQTMEEGHSDRPSIYN